MSHILEQKSNEFQPNVSPSNLISLLPFSDHSQLISKEQKGKLLRLIHVIIVSALDGLKEFKVGKLSQFDAQIGENLCQIRAYHITFLARKHLECANNSQFFQSKVDVLIDYEQLLQQKITLWDREVQNSAQYNKNLDRKESVKEFLERHSLDLELDTDIIYLTACYFLSRFSTKNQGILQSISLTTISQVLSISKSQAKKCVQTYQSTICALDFEFVQHILGDLPQLAHYTRLLPQLLKEAGDSRRILPCFVASDIVFHHALATKTPILLSIKRIETTGFEDGVCFVIIGDQYLELPSEDKEHLDLACMVIEAEAHMLFLNSMESREDYIERLLLANPMHSLLANTAIHPQYAGEQLQSLVDNPFISLPDCDYKKMAENAFHAMREYALEYGCHKDNATTLLMKHAYSNTMGFQLNKISLNEMKMSNESRSWINASIAYPPSQGIHLNS